MSEYPERICPVCGEAFTPNHKRQVYDKPYCRTIASRQRRKQPVAIEAPEPVGRRELLAEIRKLDAETARDIERLADEAGQRLADEILLLCWRAMHRAARRLLVSEGYRPKSKRSRKRARVNGT